MKPKTLASLALLATALALAAQDLSPGGARPLADGRIASGEYSFNRTIAGMKLALSLSADGQTLHAALESPAAGWVGLGFGSLRMDGASIFMGYVKGGEAPILEQVGQDHFHFPSGANKLQKGVVREEGGRTVLELELRAADFVRNGRLPLILAYGRTDDAQARHAARAAVELRIGR